MISCKYGVNDIFLDVTEIVIKTFKRGDSLYFPKGNKQFNNYFTDPCVNITKQLIINNDSKTLIIEDNDENEYILDNISFAQINKSIKISVVLNAYKRLQHLDEQINAVINQTIKPSEIIIWNNSEKELDININLYSVPIIIFTSSKNLGVWARFFAAFNCNGEYIAVFDDDTIPGNQWFENCLNCMSIKEGLYGTSGSRFSNQGYLAGSQREGWLNGNDNIEEVDIIGHAWFFKREWLKYYVNDLPDTEQFKLMGEDLHLSYTFKKYGGIRSYIAKHPRNNLSLYGSIKGWQYGTESVALSSLPGAYVRFEIAYQHWVNKLGHSLVNYEKK